MGKAAKHKIILTAHNITNTTEIPTFDLIPIQYLFFYEEIKSLAPFLRVIIKNELLSKSNVTAGLLSERFNVSFSMCCRLLAEVRENLNSNSYSLNE